MNKFEKFNKEYKYLKQKIKSVGDKKFYAYKNREKHEINIFIIYPYGVGTADSYSYNIEKQEWRMGGHVLSIEKIVTATINTYNKLKDQYFEESSKYSKKLLNTINKKINNLTESFVNQTEGDLISETFINNSRLVTILKENGDSLSILHRCKENIVSENDVILTVKFNNLIKEYHVKNILESISFIGKMLSK